MKARRLYACRGLQVLARAQTFAIGMGTITLAMAARADEPSVPDAAPPSPTQQAPTQPSPTQEAPTQPSPTPPAPTPSASLPPPEAWIQCPRCRPGHWTEDPVRPFFGLRANAGYLYLKPRLELGYGKPFSIWGGLEVVPMVTPDYVAGYSGLTLQIDWLEIRAGAQIVHAFVHQFLIPTASYNLVDLAEDTGHPSNYLDLQAEVSADIPAGPGNVIVLGTASSIQLVPSNYSLYDEATRVVVSPPPVYRGRLGYALRVLPERNARVGLVGEVIEIPDRKRQVYRAGLTATFDVDDHLQAVATFLVPVAGPDSLGFLGADYSELGIRYRWATGHKHVPQELIPTSPETAIAAP